jgi:hypothetical protein
LIAGAAGSKFLPGRCAGSRTRPIDVDPIIRMPWPPVKVEDYIPAHHKEGQYFKAFDFSQKAAFTMSHTDAAVSLAFPLYSGGMLFHLFLTDWDPHWAIGA